MRIAILTADYPAFLRELYAKNPALYRASYAQQMAARNDSLFGVADFYSRNFIRHGHQAVEIHLNNNWLQYAWAHEHGLQISEVAAPASPSTDRSPLLRRQSLRRLKNAVGRVAKPLLGSWFRR